MSLFRPFFMEENLEKKRFSSRYNFGESGTYSVTLGELLRQLGDQKENTQALLNLDLCDSPNWGSVSLREQVAKLHPGASAEQVLITTGTSEALFLLFHALKPRKVAFIWPAFQLLYEIPLAMKVPVVPLPVQWVGPLPQADVEQWCSLIKNEQPDVVVLNFPHNPTGIMISNAEKLALIEACRHVGARIIGDEHYRFLCDDTFFSDEENLALGSTLWENDLSPSTPSDIFVTGSFIKCFGTTGLRLGWCVGNSKILSVMQNDKNYLTHTVNPLSEFIASLCLEKKDDFKPFLNKLHHERYLNWMNNRIFLKQVTPTLESLGVWVRTPDGGLVTLLHIQKTPFSSQENSGLLYKKINESGIFILPFSDFEPHRYPLLPCSKAASQYDIFRLGLGAPTPLFREGLLTFIDIIKRHH